MLPEEFLKLHPIALSESEVRLCDEAVRMMKVAVDVHHDSTHICRLLNYLDDFMTAPDFKTIESQVDLKVLYISLVCHDMWRSQKDAHTSLQLLWYTIWEYIGSQKMFTELAKKYNLDAIVMRKVRYSIKKHVQFIFFPPKTIESRILKAIDELDQLSEERIALLEKKFLLDRPITAYYLRQAKFATKLFAETAGGAARYFPSIQNEINKKKQVIIKRLWQEIGDYETLLNLKRAGDTSAYQEQFNTMRRKFNLS